MAKEIERQLQDLGMAKSKFAVALEHTDDPDGVEYSGRHIAFDSTGIDRVEFLVSPNPGEPLKPLAKIASGGETSRLMLALKSVLALADRTPTLVFDEIDQGIGGRTGGIVGNKLWMLTPTAHRSSRGTQHQVICVTHLPQIAAYGDAHFQIRKEIAGDRTVTIVKELERTERVEELASMLGNVTSTTRQSVDELLKEVDHTKKAVAKKSPS
jgi:DNA repair protein RecN (Recombination protein N)